MMHDYDDYLFMAHSGHSAVFASLAVAEYEKRSGKELLTAIVIGNELAGRLGGTTLLGPHNGQMWSFLHQATAAAVTAWLIQRGSEEILNAVSMALYNPPYPNVAGFMQGESKYLTAGAPASVGVRCGLLAETGMSGNPEVLKDEEGFLNDFSYEPLPFLAGFGETWVTKTLSYKPYPGCAYLQSPLQVFDELQQEHGFDENRVKAIDVDASLLTVMMEHHSGGHRTSERLFPTSIAFSVALAFALRLKEGNYGTEYLRKEYLEQNRKNLLNRAESITVSHDWKRTLSVLDGLNDGIDLGALVDQIGFTRVLSALRAMRRRHRGLSTTKQLMDLIFSGQVFNIRKVIKSPLNWDKFHLSKAELESFSFNFGSSVEVTLDDGTRLSGTRERHAGSTGTPESETETMVRSKLREEAEAFYSEDDRVDELVSMVKKLRNVSAGEFVSLLAGD